ncbi:hypothetical protein D3C73_1137600 [compost metagenome]
MLAVMVTVGTYRGAESLTKVDVLSSLVSDEFFVRIDMIFSRAIPVTAAEPWTYFRYMPQLWIGATGCTSADTPRRGGSFRLLGRGGRNVVKERRRIVCL